MRLPLSPWSIAGVPSRQALPGFLSVPPSVCVPAVISALTVWIHNQKKKCQLCGDQTYVYIKNDGSVPFAGLLAGPKGLSLAKCLAKSPAKTIARKNSNSDPQIPRSPAML